MHEKQSLLTALILILTLSGVCAGEVIAQNQEKPNVTIPIQIIKGQVLDENGEPMPGARISVKLKSGEESFTVADNDGNFSFASTGTEVSLVASFIGYKENTLAIKTGKDKYIFRLQPDQTMLDEVVATGYNTIDKRKLTKEVFVLT